MRFPVPAFMMVGKWIEHMQKKIMKAALPWERERRDESKSLASSGIFLYSYHNVVASALSFFEIISGDYSQIRYGAYRQMNYPAGVKNVR